MKVRKLFRCIIPSKKTTRRIVGWIGVGVAVLVVSLCGLYEIEMHWITPAERNAARAALVEIDLLQNASSMNGKEFDLQEEKAQLKFGAARDLMRTHRDEEVVADLSYYFILTTAPWDEARFDLENPVPSSKVDADLKSEFKDWIAEAESRKQLRTLLHKELD